MFLMAFYAMHKPKNEVEKMKHKKTEPPQTNGRTICFSNVIFAKEGFFFHHLILIATLKVVNPTI